jgi:cytochrome c oxidase cbb3-type subunit 3
MRSIAAVCVCILALTSCRRETRDLRPQPSGVVIYADAARQSELQPGGAKSQPRVSNPYHGIAYDLGEGARLFGWYNCSGCHSNGGGGIGPPLIKTEWVYGGEPANLFDTIVKGRPNGMPAWGGRIPVYQVWQLVGYIESLNKMQPQSITPVRQDTIQQDPHTIQNKTVGVTK